jgi:hypothetical protein
VFENQIDDGLLEKCGRRLLTGGWGGVYLWGVEALRSIKDVWAFVQEQHSCNIGFTPVTNFHHCINKYTGYKAFTRNEAARLNKMLARCNEICAQEGQCLYQICIETYNELTRRRLEAHALGVVILPEPPFFLGTEAEALNKKKAG